MSEKQVPIIAFNQVDLSFGDTHVLNNVDLEIEAGKFYTLLGPSGSGKSTILKLISGQLTADSGDISFEGQRVNDVPAEKRKVNTVPFLIEELSSRKCVILFPQLMIKRLICQIYLYI